MKKYEISMSDEDKIGLGLASNSSNKTYTIKVGTNTIVCSGNSSCSVNGKKIVVKNGNVYINGKLVQQADKSSKKYARRCEDASVWADIKLDGKQQRVTESICPEEEQGDIIVINDQVISDTSVKGKIINGSIITGIGNIFKGLRSRSKKNISNSKKDPEK